MNKILKAFWTAVKKVFFGEAVELTNQFPTWKTIRIGIGLKTADDFRRALNQSGCLVNEMASLLFGQPGFTVATEEIEVNLVDISAVDLGLPNDAPAQKIFKRAKKSGLKFCPPEVASQLILQDKGQYDDQWRLLAMKPIVDLLGNGAVFGVAHCYGGWALGLDVPSRSTGGRWIFCK